MAMLIGTTGIPRRPEPSLDLVELVETFHQPVRQRTAKGWRKRLAETTRVALRAAKDVTHPRDATTGHFRAGEPVEAAWKGTVEAARFAEALAIVFRTPASFTPTPGNLEAFRRFAERAAADLPDALLVWEPVGIWEDDEAAALAAEAGFVIAVDPLRTPPPPGAAAFCRMAGPTGVRGRYDELDFEEVLDLVAEHDRSLVVFDYPGALGDARRLAAARKAAQQ